MSLVFLQALECCRPDKITQERSHINDKGLSLHEICRQMTDNDWCLFGVPMETGMFVRVGKIAQECFHNNQKASRMKCVAK